MSESLVFMMGQFQAEFPTDRCYAKNHMWASQVSENQFRFGFSGYAVRLLQDVYFLEFSIEPGMVIESGQEIGSIESKKAESGLYAPMAGTVAQVNLELLEDPSAINADKYGDGWLFELTTQKVELLSPAQYILHLENAWEVAQKTIKGQMNA